MHAISEVINHSDTHRFFACVFRIMSYCVLPHANRVKFKLSCTVCQLGSLLSSEPSGFGQHSLQPFQSGLDKGVMGLEDSKPARLCAQAMLPQLPLLTAHSPQCVTDTMQHTAPLLGMSLAHALLHPSPPVSECTYILLSRWLCLTLRDSVWKLLSQPDELQIIQFL